MLFSGFGLVVHHGPDDRPITATISRLSVPMVHRRMGSSSTSARLAFMYETFLTASRCSIET